MINLTIEQQMIIDDAKLWYYHFNQYLEKYPDANEQVFQFEGGPGTGKSFVLNFILQSLDIPRNMIAPMAYTGTAAVNMRLKGLHNASTIHSWIYKAVSGTKKDKDGNTIINSYFDRPLESLEFQSKPLKGIKLMIIDEAWTVPLSMKYDIEKNGIKIIACGDRRQLPPINDAPAYLTNGKIHYLTQIMRQEENSSIVKLAYAALNNININYGYYGDALVIDEKDLTDDMIRSSDIIICNKNSTRDFYNKKVRKLYGFNTDLPSYGERVICRNNNKNISIEGINLANGLIGSVVNFPDPSGFDGKTFKLNFQPDVLGSAFNVSCSYKYFKAPYKEREILKKSKYDVGEKFEYAYAITTYLSQGSQFNNVIFIDEWLGDQTTALRYVAITRAVKRLIIVRK